MTDTIRYACCEDDRRAVLAARPDLNGIDHLEVLDPGPAVPPEQRQRTLFVHFLHDPTPLGITAANVAITGGTRRRDITVVDATVTVDPRAGSAGPVLVVEVDRPGDRSTYELRLVPTAASPLPGLDPVLRAVPFSFTVNCPTPFDPRDRPPPPADPGDEPALNRLARDYPALRQALLDRLAVLSPTWRERNPADVGMALVELWAYLGDQLAYRQDAVATEAYLGTCRLRTSARRHARLVDYAMHDGANARTWVQVALDEGATPFTLEGGTFLTTVPGAPTVLEPGSRAHTQARHAAAAAFELLRPARLVPAHNVLRFHTWGARRCWLPAGAVAATLRGDLPDLEPGMVLVLVEALGPRTGDPDDADRSRRHAVVVTEVEHAVDPVGGALDPEPHDDPVPVTNIRWADADALPFPFCLSTETDPELGSAFVPDVTVALGNLVLADHGDPVAEELPPVPAGTVVQVVAGDGDPCGGPGTRRAPARYRPVLSRGPLTQAVPFDRDQPLASATAAIDVDPHRAVPALVLDDGTTQPWVPQRDLLASGGGDRHVVAEVEGDGRARLRFGDGTHGMRPATGTRFTARYRVGVGTAGNLGAGALGHLVTAEAAASGVAAVTNPMPARGGTEPETIEEVRQRAPHAFRPVDRPGLFDPDGRPRPDGRSLRRAVTPGDYAAVLEAQPEVQRATATFTWTGSWPTVTIAVDLAGGAELTPEREDELRSRLEPYRLAGHDIELVPPRMVGLELVLRIRVAAGHDRAAVRRAVLATFSAGTRPSGRRGLFHPDELTFGQTVHLGPLYAAARGIDGVAAVSIPVFRRLDRPDTVREERIVLGRREIARLDNDPDFPERGVLQVLLEDDHG